MRYWTPREFTDPPTVTMLVASYLNGDRSNRLHALRCLLCSFMAQTYPHWRAVVVHDGPLDQPEIVDYVAKLDSRIAFETTPGKIGHFGHKYRHQYASKVADGWIGFTNDDNYYAPVYFEWLLSHALRQKAEMVYCDMVHSHKMWKPMTTQARYKYLDLGGFLATAALIKKTPWTDFSFKGDGTYINALRQRARKVVKVDATLFVHN